MTRPVVPRPLVHFTPRRNWMNDPNGLVHHRGVWHLFFQYNPEGSDWGNMSWGHATSLDLENWVEQPVALWHREGEQIFSGSIVVSSEEPLEFTAVYTSAYDDGHQAQSLATSADAGTTWHEDASNPVLDRGTTSFRDPKILRFTDEHGDGRWVMVAVEAEERRVLFYSSSDLRSWQYLSDFGPLGEDGVVWECPDLLPLALDGDPLEVQWVLTLSTNPIDGRADPEGSSMSAVLGHFDGRRFTSKATELTRLDHGRDFYAGVTFDSAPDGDAVMLGWMSNWRYAAAVPSDPWRGAMSLPRTLALRCVDGRPRVVQRLPASVAGRLARAVPATVSGPVALTLTGHSILELVWEPALTGALRLVLRGDVDAVVEIAQEGHSTPLTIRRGGPAAEAVHPDFAGTSVVPSGSSARRSLVAVLDGPLLEVFLDDGEATASQLVILGTGTVTAELSTERAHVRVTSTDLTDGSADPDPRSAAARSGEAERTSV